MHLTRDTVTHLFCHRGEATYVRANHINVLPKRALLIF